MPRFLLPVLRRSGSPTEREYPIERPLFDVPFHRDRYVQRCALVVGLVVLGAWIVMLEAAIEVHLRDAWALAGAVAVWWCFAFVVIALLPALVRHKVRSVRAARAAAAAAAEAAIAPPTLRAGPRASWVTAPTLRTAIGKTGPDGELLPHDQRPPELFIKLDSQLTIPAVPVRLTWRAPGADVIRISVLPGDHPPSGWVNLTLLATGDITVMASNAYGSRTERTALVQVLPMPLMRRMALPAPPNVMLGATIDVSLNWGEPVLARLEAVLGEHERQRLAQIPQLPEHLTMAQVASSIRGPMAELLGWRPVGPLWLTRPADKPERTGPAVPQVAARWLADQAGKVWAGMRTRVTRSERPVPAFDPGVIAPLPVHGTGSGDNNSRGNVSVVAAPTQNSTPYGSTAYDHNNVTVKNGGWPKPSHDESRM